MSETDFDDNDFLILTMQKDLERAISEAGIVSSFSMETRRALNMVIAESARTQRLYFVVRSVFMSLISALIYFIVVLFLGEINAVQAAFLGVFVFITALVASRIFDKQILKASKKLIRLLTKRRKLKIFILRKL